MRNPEFYDDSALDQQEDDCGLLSLIDSLDDGRPPIVRHGNVLYPSFQEWQMRKQLTGRAMLASKPRPLRAKEEIS